MTPEEATHAELGARILAAHFSGDQQALEGTLQGVLGTLATLADGLVWVAISAGRMFGEMAKVNLDVALRRLGDSEVRLLPVGDTNRRAAISLALAVAGDPMPTRAPVGALILQPWSTRPSGSRSTLSRPPRRAPKLHPPAWRKPSPIPPSMVRV